MSSRQSLAGLEASDLSLEEFAAQAMAVVASAAGDETPARSPDEVDGDSCSAGSVAPSLVDVASTEPLPSFGVPGDALLTRDGVAAGPILEDELLRGRGPFGPRDAVMRLLLVPSSSYSEGDDGLRRRLAELLDIDLYTAGAHLKRSWPGFLSAPDDLERGGALVEALENAGLRILVVEGRDWVMPRLPVYVTSLEAGETEGCWRFQGEDGVAHEVLQGDLTWAALGEITGDTRERPTEQERNRWGLVQRPTGGVLGRSSGAHVLVDLCRSSSLRPLRIRTDHFDFGCLGAPRSLSASVNLKSLVQMLSPLNGPRLPVDSSFRRVPHLPPRPGLADRAGGGAEALSREVEFTEYVLLRDMVHRRSG